MYPPWRDDLGLSVVIASVHWEPIGVWVGAILGAIVVAAGLLDQRAARRAEAARATAAAEMAKAKAEREAEASRLATVEGQVRDIHGALVGNPALGSLGLVDAFHAHVKDEESALLAMRERSRTTDARLDEIQTATAQLLPNHGTHVVDKVTATARTVERLDRQVAAIVNAMPGVEIVDDGAS